MKIDARTILVLLHPREDRTLLLLRRSSTKKLFPDLITGIGGKVEFEMGEGENIEKSLFRELEEETKIKADDLRDLRLVLTTMDVRGDCTVVLYWYVARLNSLPNDLSCTEGELEWLDESDLAYGLVPTAAVCIPFIHRRYQSNQSFTGTFREENGDLILVHNQIKV